MDATFHGLNIVFKKLCKINKVSQSCLIFIFQILNGILLSGTGYAKSSSGYGIEQWNISLPSKYSEQWLFTSPAFGANGVLYCGANNVAPLNGGAVLVGHLNAIDTKNKKLFWNVELTHAIGAGPVTTPVVGTDNVVYVGVGKSVLAIDGQSGKQLWELYTGFYVTSSPTIGTDGTVIAITESTVIGINPKTGKQIWDFLGKFQFSYSAVTTDDDSIFFTDRNYCIYSLNSKTGLLNWKKTVWKDFAGSLSVGINGVIYLSCVDGSILAIDGKNGDLRWSSSLDLQPMGPLAIGPNGVMYIIAAENSGGGGGSLVKSAKLKPASRLIAIDVNSGGKIWDVSIDVDFGRFFRRECVSPTVGLNGTVYVSGDASINNGLFAVNGLTGAIIWGFESVSQIGGNPVINMDGSLFLGGSQIYSISSDSLGLAKSPWPKNYCNNSNSGKAVASIGQLSLARSHQSDLSLTIVVSPDFDTILEYSTNLNQWSEQQRFSRQTNTPSIVVPLKMDQTKAMEYWRTRNQ